MWNLKLLHGPASGTSMQMRSTDNLSVDQVWARDNEKSFGPKNLEFNFGHFLYASQKSWTNRFWDTRAQTSRYTVDKLRTGTTSRAVQRRRQTWTSWTLLRFGIPGIHMFLVKVYYRESILPRSEFRKIVTLPKCTDQVRQSFFTLYFSCVASQNLQMKTCKW